MEEKICADYAINNCNSHCEKWNSCKWGKQYRDKIKEFLNPIGESQLTDKENGYNEGFLAGCHAQAERDRGAVHDEIGYAKRNNFNSNLPGLNIALAAIKSLAVGKGG